MDSRGIQTCRHGVIPVCWLAIILSCHRRSNGPHYGSDGPHSGWTAIWAGDVDADDVPDVILGTRFEQNPTDYGVVRVLSGRTGSVLRVLDKGGKIGTPLWKAVGTVGDINGDGSHELWWKSGNTHLVIGPGTDGPPLATMDVYPSEVVVPIGDLNGDLLVEIVVSGYPLRASVSAISIRDRYAFWTISLPRGKKLNAPPFAWSGCAVGDANGDGIAEVAIIDDREYISLIDGTSGSVLVRLAMRVSWLTGQFDSVGDVDDDDINDLLVCEAIGKPLRVISSVDGRELRLVRQECKGVVFSPGDVDGDGHKDIAVCGTDGLEVLRAIDGVSIHSLSNVSCAPGSGDYDGDGCDDLLVTRNVCLGESEDAPVDLWLRGEVEVISGRDGTLLRRWDGSMLSATK